MYKYKVYKMMIWYLYLQCGDYHIRLVNTVITSQYFCVKTFKIYYLNSFQVYKTPLLTMITTLYISSPEVT